MTSCPTAATQPAGSGAQPAHAQPAHAAPAEQAAYTAQPSGSSPYAEDRVQQRASLAKELAERLARGDALSKNEQKRLVRLEHHDERKENRKREKKRRKMARGALLSSQGAPQDAADLPGGTTAPVVLTPAELHARAWAFWRRIGSPTRVLAPMVNQSELAFRLLARRHGAQLTYTPMLHATLFATEETYRLSNFDPHPEDRPLVVQFCGDDPATLLAAARLVEGKCDAVEINCGCPQGIARRGHYGAFLLDEPDLIVAIVEHMAKHLNTPVMVKMRAVRPRAPPGCVKGGGEVWERTSGEGAASSSAEEEEGSAAQATAATAAEVARVLASDAEARAYEATVRLALRLQAAGAAVLTLHGRTKEQKTNNECDWRAIATLKRVLSIPVVANGGIESCEDVPRCLAATGADGVMSSEAALENPALFERAPVTRLAQARLAKEYLELAHAHPPRCSSVVKAHLFKLLYMALDANQDQRLRLGAANSAVAACDVAEALIAMEEEEAARAPELMGARCDADSGPYLTWYRRHRPERRGVLTQLSRATADGAAVLCD